MSDPFAIRYRVDHLINAIDEVINEQLNLIMHHAQFQVLESAWRSIDWLLQQSSDWPQIKIKILDVDWTTLAGDLAKAAEFDQSRFFDLLYNREMGMPGGEPFGLLIADYYLGHDKFAHHDAITTLQQISMVSASAFCPFITGVSPTVFGIRKLNQFVDIDLSLPVDESYRQRWIDLRKTPDTRFVGLVAPRVLMRMPYQPHCTTRNEGFPFIEEVEQDGKHLLWGNGAFAFALTVLRTFAYTGWFADLRGIGDDAHPKGYLSPDVLQPYDLKLESQYLSAQPPVEIRVSYAQEQMLCAEGIIPITTSYLLPGLIFNANPSLHNWDHYIGATAQQNAQISSMLQYVLCASRFAHYIKIIMREETGGIRNPEILQKKLHSWLAQYTVGNSNGNQELQRRYPLRAAAVKLSEIAGQPGNFVCTTYLEPHFQLDGVSTTLHVVANTTHS